jgi:uncharacterized DUF497 family protein
MQIEWSDPIANLKDDPSIRDVQESFEDPMGLRLFPDSDQPRTQSRAFSLGRTLSGRGIFSVYRSDGKYVWVIAARPMTDEEEYFYNRKVSEWM